MITLIIVRHGESMANVQKLRSGQSDFALSELGFEQAELTGAYLKKTFRIDKIYASDLSRTMDTARPAAKAFGLEVISEPDFREVNSGIWEGTPFPLAKEQPFFLPWLNDEDIAPEGGESNKHMKERVLACLDRILAENPGKCVAVFTHWGPKNKIIQSWLEVKPEWREKIEGKPYCNSSVTVMEYSDDGVPQKLVCLGYSDHLEGKITSTGSFQL